ncbi:MAG: hypothetical protein MZV64_15445 [Ignavibacteriales bacterium]|nr:hypothetical protein [Ignavibacteriales bacterium]
MRGESWLHQRHRSKRRFLPCLSRRPRRQTQSFGCRSPFRCGSALLQRFSRPLLDCLSPSGSTITAPNLTRSPSTGNLAFPHLVLCNRINSLPLPKRNLRTLGCGARSHHHH